MIGHNIIRMVARYTSQFLDTNITMEMYDISFQELTDIYTWL